MTLHYSVPTCNGLASYFADSIELNTQSFTFQQIDGIFGAHTYHVRYQSGFLVPCLQDDGIGRLLGVSPDDLFA